MTKKWGNSVEREIKRRIMISIYAFAYEIENDSLISDGEYDKLAMELDLEIRTGNKIMDRFFENEFDASTGMWIYKHPGLERIKELYFEYFAL